MIKKKVTQVRQNFCLGSFVLYTIWIIIKTKKKKTVVCFVNVTHIRNKKVCICMYFFVDHTPKNKCVRDLSFKLIKNKKAISMVVKQNLTL